MKPDVIIGTCLYNRNDKWENYLAQIEKTAKVNYHVYLMNHFDEHSPIAPAQAPSGKNFTIINVYNLGLRGYNIPLEIGRLLDIPVILANDDVLFPDNWDKLLNTQVTEVTREGKKVEINPDTIGCVGPCYVNPGCMKHQLYDPSKTGSTNVDYVVGHAQLITKQALRKGFRFDEKICTIFGAFDCYQSVWMCANDLNVLVNQDVCFDFPESKESHFHNGNPNKFKDKLDSEWKKMTGNINAYQQEHIKKWGYNKWYQ